MKALEDQGYTYVYDVGFSESDWIEAKELGKYKICIKKLYIYEPSNPEAVYEYNDGIVTWIDRDFERKYSINYNDSSLTIYISTLTFSSLGASDSKIYDGKPLVANSELITLINPQDLPTGYTWSCMTNTSITNYGSTAIECIFNIRDENGNDVTHLFLIKHKHGKLEISKREITIIAATPEVKKLDAPLAEDFYCHEYECVGTLADGHIIDRVDFSETSIICAGEIWAKASNTIDQIVIIDSSTGEDVTSNYKYTKVSGLLVVERIQ